MRQVGRGPDGVLHYLTQPELARHRRNKRIWTFIGLVVGVLFFLVLMAPFYL
jgi:hypothetical protein